MKVFIVIVVIAAIVAYVALKGDKKQTAKQPAPVKTETVEKQKPESKASSAVQEVNSVINYGIGATQLKAKQKSESKLKAIQQNHNADMQKALSED